MITTLQTTVPQEDLFENARNALIELGRQIDVLEVPAPDEDVDLNRMIQERKVAYHAIEHILGRHPRPHLFCRLCMNSGI